MPARPLPNPPGRRRRVTPAGRPVFAFDNRYGVEGGPGICGAAVAIWLQGAKCNILNVPPSPNWSIRVQYNSQGVSNTLGTIMQQNHLEI
jgi:hypothetical protein